MLLGRSVERKRDSTPSRFVDVGKEFGKLRPKFIFLGDEIARRPMYSTFKSSIAKNRRRSSVREAMAGRMRCLGVAGKAFDRKARKGTPERAQRKCRHREPTTCDRRPPTKKRMRFGPATRTAFTSANSAFCRSCALAPASPSRLAAFRFFQLQRQGTRPRTRRFRIHHARRLQSR